MGRIDEQGNSLVKIVGPMPQYYNATTDDYEAVQGAGGKMWVKVADGVTVSASATRPSDTTAYAALDVVGENPATAMSFVNVLTAGEAYIITGAKLRIDINAVPAGMLGFRLHLYDAAPTAIADNAAYNLPSGDRTKYMGYVDFPTPDDLGDTLWSQSSNTLSGKLAAGSTTLYGILQTIGAYTPAASTVHSVTLIVAPV